MQQRLPTPGTTDCEAAAFWFGVTDWEVEDGWATPLRLGPIEGVSEKLSSTALRAAGVRVELHTDAAQICLALRSADAGVPQTIDLVVDDRLVERVSPNDSGQVTFPLPGQLSRVEIWLPHRGTCQVGEIHLTDATLIEPVRRRPRWIAYGSSITHCAAAEGPTDTWPALVARRLGWDLTSFGFSGLALLDQPVAEVMAAARPDIATICAGINIYNQATFDTDSLPARLHEFIGTVRAGRPDGALGVMSPIASPDRETRPNAVGMTLQDVRNTVEETAGRTPGVAVIAGDEIFATADADLLPDGLHPSAAGYRLMADRLTPELAGLSTVGADN